MSMRESKFAKSLDIAWVRFIYQIIIGLVVVVAMVLGIYYGVIARLDAQDTKINSTTSKIDIHVESTKNEPLTELQLQGEVEDLVEDVDDLDTLTENHTEVINRLVISEAVQQVQNTAILDKLKSISDKLDGQ